jgi:hypothetical protein
MLRRALFASQPRSVPIRCSAPKTGIAVPWLLTMMLSGSPRAALSTIRCASVNVPHGKVCDFALSATPPPADAPADAPGVAL